MVLALVLLLVLAALGLLIAALTTANTLWAWISVTISVVAAVILVVDWVGARRRRRAAADAEPTATRDTGIASSPAGTGAAADRDDLDVDPFTDQGPPSGDLAWLGADAPPERAPDNRTPVGYTSGSQTPGSQTPGSPASGSRTSGSRSADIGDDQLEATGFHAPPSRFEDSGQHEPVALADLPTNLDPDREPPEEATDAADLLIVADLRVDVRVLDERPRYHLPRCAWLGARPSITLPAAEARELGFTPCAICTPDAVLAARHREGRGPRQPRPTDAG
ncbi:hypothetical protein V5P93_005425 [Actinokineospora auranticolor]|uniref:Uncharacterized protein n=1 Tax=Actinokineospora auranticolor TaxID=155976 RepID=A0A2S6GQT8_9PSEU|nr:hypothetical protein [Actinokineospora auranticolor]PPK67547.1 hypothetical protein CLV40_107212 [Actinokineospora auranticolor]